MNPDVLAGWLTVAVLVLNWRRLVRLAAAIHDAQTRAEARWRNEGLAALERIHNQKELG